MDLAGILRGALAWGVLPLWIAACVGDWLCHRARSIETTSGWRESALHLVMVAELGPPTIAAALLEVNGLVVAWMLLGFLAHEITVYVDLKYSATRRDIPAIEQLVHSALEFMPAFGGLLVMMLHADALASLVPGGDPADFSVRLKAEPLPAPLLTGYAIAIFALVLAPLLEEFARCVRAAKRPAVRLA